MTMNHLPPQAYTRETMSKAFQWLQTQAPQIREIATTPDILVSLYQKAQMHGEEALERPSIQNFKNELKSLAGMMGELQGPKNSAAASSQPSVSQQSVAAAASTPQMTLSQNTQASSASSATAPASATAQTQTTTSNTFDSRSWDMIQEVKNELNLSSENEALRMLISLGYNKAKTIFSK